MKKEELYEILGIGDASDFTYYENLEQLFETDKEYSSDIIYELLDDIDLEFFSEMCGSYFDQMQENIPDEETDFYTLIENIKRVLVGMADSLASDEDAEGYDETLEELAEETTRFHNWYIEEKTVKATNHDTGEESLLSVRDAVYQARSAKLLEEGYSFDFENAMDYELSDYSMSFADLAGGDY